MTGKRNKRIRWGRAITLLIFILLFFTAIVFSVKQLIVKQGDDSSNESGTMDAKYQYNDPYKNDEDGHYQKDSDQEEPISQGISELTESGLTDQALAGENGEEEQTIQVIVDGNYPLALITKETRLKSDYVPSDLQPIPSSMNPFYNMQLRKEALDNLKNLFLEAYSDGISLSIRSAYRSYATQKGLFEDYATRYGKEEANRFSAKPGQSEHQLGTTVDFSGTDVDFTAEFANTDQGRWLAGNAHRFGFAMSYPEGKEDVTGYIFEPWHYRYIGVEEAEAWKVSGVTLKEYLQSKPQYYQ